MYQQTTKKVEEFARNCQVRDKNSFDIVTDIDGVDFLVDYDFYALVCAGTDVVLTPDDLVNGELITDFQGYVYSKDFADENLVKCDCCGHWDSVSDGVDTECGEHFCENCIYHSRVIKCSECGEYHQETYYRSRGTSGEDKNGYDMFLCENCVLDYATCEGCGCLVKRDESEYKDGGYWCDDCYDARYKKDIHAYHYDGDETDYGMEHLGEESRYKDPLLGVEVEIDKKVKNVKSDENREEHAREIREAIGEKNCVICEDGSLDYGFEIVSCPASLRYHRYTLDWTRGFLKALEFGYRGHDVGTCGVHVHIDRRFFYKSLLTSEEVEGAMFVVLKNNVDWIKRFSRRFNFTYCEINGTKDDTERIKDMDKYDKMWNKDAKYDAKKDRYQAINFSRDDTIEFRIFRGTLDSETFYATLEFVDLFARLVQKCSCIEEAMPINLDVFVYYAETLKYTHFLNYCKGIGLIDNTETGF